MVGKPHLHQEVLTQVLPAVAALDDAARAGVLCEDKKEHILGLRFRV